jgi:hypothetical protein
VLHPIKGFVDLVDLLRIPIAQSVEQCDPAFIGSAVEPIGILLSFVPLLLDVS